MRAVRHSCLIDDAIHRSHWGSLSHLAATAGLALALTAPWATAQAEALYLSGAEASPHANYVYLGRLASLEHDQLQNGWAYRLWLDRASYSYRANDRRFDGTSVGLEAGVGYLFGSAPFTGSVFVSAIARDTRIRPGDPRNPTDGFHTGLKLNSDLNYQFSPRWSGNLGASYTPLGDAYWVRMRMLWAATDTLRWGLEQAWHGDENYRARQTGLVLSGLQWGPAQVTLKGGVRYLRGERNAPYVGIELGWNY